jgi:hypothetical protein
LSTAVKSPNFLVRFSVSIVQAASQYLFLISNDVGYKEDRLFDF